MTYFQLIQSNQGNVDDQREWQNLKS